MEGRGEMKAEDLHGCLYDNPENLRREYYVYNEVRYSIAFHIIQSNQVPREFDDSWKRPFKAGETYGMIRHIHFLNEKTKTSRSGVSDRD